MGERAYCKSCNKPIVWVETQNGNKMPLNYPGERRFVIDSGNGMLAKQRETYVSHFATCPHAAQHRGKGGGNG